MSVIRRALLIFLWSVVYTKVQRLTGQAVNLSALGKYRGEVFHLYFHAGVLTQS